MSYRNDDNKDDTLRDVRTAAIVVGCVAVILGGFFAHKKTRKSPQACVVADNIDLTKLDLPPNAGAAAVELNFMSNWDEHLQKRAIERSELENDTSYGEPIWLSLYAKRGSLRHWALLVHQNKYELRLLEKDKAPPATLGDADLEAGLGNGEQVEVLQEPIDDVRNSSGFGRYYEKVIKADPNYSSAMKERAEAIKASRKPEYQHPNPEVGLLYIVHIGWTRRTKSQVDEICLNVEENFGSYHLLSNNCQHFVRRLAAGIVTKTSQDWKWFQHASSQSYNYVGPETIDAPGGVARLCVERLTRLKESSEITDPHMLQSIDEHIEQLNKYVKNIWREQNDLMRRQGQAALEMDQEAQQEQGQQNQQNQGMGAGGGAVGGG